MSTLSLVSLVLALFGALFLVLGFVRIFRRRVFSGLVLQVPALLLLALAVAALMMASSMHVYQRLDYESPVARISFTRIDEKIFSARLEDYGLDQTHYLELRGDEWQLDAQIQVWHSYANLLGLDTRYRLHRLSGRYSDIEQEQTAARTVHALYSDSQPALVDSFDLPGDWLEWLVDTSYGNAVYLPMTDDASYEISISQKGLVVRPDNDAAKRAIRRWIGL